MGDILIVAGGVLVLLPFFYFISSLTPNVYITGIYFLILIPTLGALINGAPFVPTPMKAVKKMLKIAKLRKGDKVYDIGCGDGRVVYLAAKDYGAKATGFELSPFVYLFARMRHLLWRSKGHVKFGDFKGRDLSDADVIFCYLLPDTLTKLEPKLSRELKPGTKVISYSFPIAPWEEVKKHSKVEEENIGPIWEYVKK